MTNHANHAETVLRKSLDEIDSYRRRWVITFGITAALSQAAWIAFVIGAQNANEKQTILLATLALAMTVFGGVFLLVLLIFRMTLKILQAIEVGVRADS
jgi:hypothetical protein